MINSKDDYLFFLKQDRIALGKNRLSFSQRMLEFVFPDPIWKFQRLLRKLEYYKNCRKGPVSRIVYYFNKYRFRKHSIRLGFSIPENVFGPGLAIPHYGTIVVNANARIGANCRLHVCTNIGASGGTSAAPHIGDNVYIAPGAKIFGDIRIANNVAIAANSAVNRSFTEENILIAGVPARKIKSIDIKTIIKHLNEDSHSSF